MSLTNDPHVFADALRFVVIVGCLFLGYQVTARAKYLRRLASVIHGCGLLGVAIYIGGTEFLRFGHDIGYWRLPVGIVGVGLLNLAYWYISNDKVLTPRS